MSLRFFVLFFLTKCAASHGLKLLRDLGHTPIPSTWLRFEVTLNRITSLSLPGNKASVGPDEVVVIAVRFIPTGDGSKRALPLPAPRVINLELVSAVR